MATPIESGYVTPVIETARVINVNIEDWSVDMITEYADKRYLDVQVMTPYFHYMNGEGFYAMPEVGALAWVCKPSDGHSSTPFVLGFQAPFDETTVSYRAGKQSLNPGDIMLRTRDENFIVLRRGGVIQIGSTPTSQRMYVPIQNMIRDFCENYQLYTLGGELTWTVGRDEETTTGDSPTKFFLGAKTLANEPAHVATLTIGSHGEQDMTTLELTVNESGDKDAAVMAKLVITREGDVSWQIEKTWTVSVKEDIAIESREGSVSIEAVKGEMTLTAKTDLTANADGNYLEDIKGNSKEKVKGSKVVDCADIKLGGNGASDPAVLGNKLVSLMGELIGYLSGAVCPPNGPLSTATSIGTLSAKLSNILAQKTKVS